MTRITRRLLQWPAIALLLVFQAGCGGGSSSEPTAKYSVNAAVSGLVGTGLVLALNAGGQVTVNSDSTVQFPTLLAVGSSYTVTILTQPTSPPQQCVVSNGSGTVMTAANVTSVVVTCPEPSDITAPNLKTTLLYSTGPFDFPQALIQGADGNLYGTMPVENAGCGMVFQVTLTGVETVLYSFAGGANDGCSPIQLLQGSDGNLYGITSGVSHGRGLTEVFKLTTAGVITTLHVFPTGTTSQTINTDGIGPTALIQGGDGNLYGTTAGGGASGNGIVFQLSLAGVEKVLHSFAGGPADGANGGALVYGSDGSLYGVTPSGGSYFGGGFGAGQGTFYKVDASGTETVLDSFQVPPQGISLGMAGNFYVWNGASSDSSASVSQITASGAMTTLASWCGDPSCVGAGPSLGNFLLASDGRVYGLVSNYLGTFLANINPSATSGNPMVAYYFPTGIYPPYLLFEGADNIFYGVSASDILAITNLISP